MAVNGFNPNFAQIKKNVDDLVKKPKVLACIHAAVSEIIFTRIMSSESLKETQDKLKEDWDKLREEFKRSDRIKSIRLTKRLWEFLI